MKLEQNTVYQCLLELSAAFASELNHRKYPCQSTYKSVFLQNYPPYTHRTETHTNSFHHLTRSWCNRQDTSVYANKIWIIKSFIEFWKSNMGHVLFARDSCGHS